jgi:uncharacterized sulfatase
MDERNDSVRMVRDRRYRYLRNYTPHLPYAQPIAYMEQGNIMKELRAAKKAGKLPPAAALFMGPNKPVEELYDVENDPHELKNLAASPQHAAVLKRMRVVQEKWALDTRDVGLIPEPDIDERGRKTGARYNVLRQPGSEQLIRELRSLVEGVNRGNQTRTIRTAATHADPAMRYWSIIGLTKNSASATAAREIVLRACSDIAPAVRIAALRAAAQDLKDESAITRLASELKDTNPYVRLYAAQALEALGPKAESVRDALTAASSDENEYVKRTAEHALAALSKG